MTSPFPQNGVPYAPKVREWPYLRKGWSDTLHVWLGFSGSADRMALFPVTSNTSWRQAATPSWIISNGHISATPHSIHLYSAHRAVIVAMAQLSCYLCIVRSCHFCISVMVSFRVVRLSCIYCVYIQLQLCDGNTQWRNISPRRQLPRFGRHTWLYGVRRSTRRAKK